MKSLRKGPTSMSLKNNAKDEKRGKLKKLLIPRDFSDSVLAPNIFFSQSMLLECSYWAGFSIWQLSAPLWKLLQCNDGGTMGLRSAKRGEGIVAWNHNWSSNSRAIVGRAWGTISPNILREGCHSTKLLTWIDASIHGSFSLQP